MKRKYQVIGACSGWGAQLRACEKGPEELVEGRVFERLQDEGIQIQEIEMIYPKIRARDEEIPLSKTFPLICDFNRQLVHTVKGAIKKGWFPVVIGGDHSIAVGTWNAFEVPLGLIWVDAHMDSHTPETTPSGAFHGMPLAALLGYGNPEWVHLIHRKPILKPENVVLIGVHSFEEGEAALLKKLNVRIYFLDEVRKRGLKEIVPEAIAHVTRGVSHYGVSIDLDAFSLEEVPGVGSPAPGGMRPKELLPLLPHFGKDPRWIGLELVEFNPERDIEHKTREVSFQLLKEVMR